MFSSSTGTGLFLSATLQSSRTTDHNFPLMSQLRTEEVAGKMKESLGCQGAACKNSAAQNSVSTSIVNKGGLTNATEETVDPAYIEPVKSGHNVSIQVTGRDDGGPEVPTFTVTGNAVSDLKITIKVQDHDTGREYTISPTRKTKFSSWRIDNGFLEERYGPSTISGQEPLASIALGYWVAIYTALSVAASMKRGLEPSFVDRLESFPPEVFSRAQSLGEVASIIGFPMNGGPQRGPIGLTEGPIIALTDGPPAPLPTVKVKKGTSHDEPGRSPGPRRDNCCIGHDMKCSVGRDQNTLHFCGGIKVDFSRCCQKHDIRLFCGDRWDLPMPITLATTPIEIEAWALSLNIQFGACVFDAFLKAWARDSNWLCRILFTIPVVAVSFYIAALLTAGLFLFTQGQILWWLGGHNNRTIGIGGEYDHCCICGGDAHTPTYCCHPDANRKYCKNSDGSPRELCGLDYGLS